MNTFVKIESGATISYKLQGPVSKPVIVMVNGSIFNYKQFDPVLLPTLQKKLKKNYSFLQYDYVGISESSELEGQFNFQTIVDEHKQVLEALGIDTAHHFGYSKGSIISSMMAAQNSSFVSTFAGYGNPNLILWDRTVDNFKLRLQYMEAIKGLWHRDISNDTYKMVYENVLLPTIFPGKNVNTLSLKEKALSNIIKNKIKPMLLSTKIENLHKLYYYYTQPLSSEFLEKYEKLIKSIKKPTLLMHGDKDETVPLESSILLNEWIENSELKIFRGYTHTGPVLSKLQGTKLMTKYASFIKNNT